MFEGLLQPTHLLLILGIALLFFGPSKLPELGKGIGQAIRGFKKEMNASDEPPAPPAVPPAPRPPAIDVQPSKPVE